MKILNTLIFLFCLSIISIPKNSQAQCATANFQSYKGGAITCNFPFLHQHDVDHYVNRIEETDAEAWYTEKKNEAQRSVQKWKTTNLRILMLANSEDIISDAQLETLRLAMNLHLVDIAKADNNDQLEWSHMPIVEEIILRPYPEELQDMFDMLGYLVFSDPDNRNGDTPLNNYVRDLASANDINTIINVLDDPIDVAFRASAQIYCNDPGEFMTISVSKNNRVSLANKYLVQFAQACVHAIGHTNYANHQGSLTAEENTSHCAQNNHAKDGAFESIMVNGLENEIYRNKKSKPFGNSWSKGNSDQVINTYIQRGLLLPLFDYDNNATEEKEDEKQNFISVFPNPVEELLTIELKNDIQYDLSIYNVNGKLMSQQVLESFTTQIDVSTYDSGVYILEFFCASSGERVTKKVEKIY